MFAWEPQRERINHLATQGPLHNKLNTHHPCSDIFESQTQWRAAAALQRGHASMKTSINVKITGSFPPQLLRCKCQTLCHSEPRLTFDGNNDARQTHVYTRHGERVCVCHVRKRFVLHLLKSGWVADLYSVCIASSISHSPILLLRKELAFCQWLTAPHYLTMDNSVRIKTPACRPRVTTHASRTLEYIITTLIFERMFCFIFLLIHDNFI